MIRPTTGVTRQAHASESEVIRDGLRALFARDHRRLHGTIAPGPGYATPAAHENAYYDQTPTATEAATR